MSADALLQPIQSQPWSIKNTRVQGIWTFVMLIFYMALFVRMYENQMQSVLWDKSYVQLCQAGLDQREASLAQREASLPQLEANLQQSMYLLAQAQALQQKTQADPVLSSSSRQIEAAQRCVEIAQRGVDNAKAGNALSQQGIIFTQQGIKYAQQSITDSNTVLQRDIRVLRLIPFAPLVAVLVGIVGSVFIMMLSRWLSSGPPPALGC